MSSKTGYIVTFSPDNWLNGSMSMDNRLYCCLSPDNWLYSSLSPRQLLNRSIFTENLLYSCLSHVQLAIVWPPLQKIRYVVNFP